MNTQSLSDTVRDRIADDPRSVYAIAKSCGINQPTLQRFASGDRDLTGEKLGILIADLGGKLTWRKNRKN